MKDIFIKFINYIKKSPEKLLSKLITVGRSVLTGLCVGGIVGIIATLFSLCLTWAAKTRAEYPFIKFALPAAGVLIVFLYKVTHDVHDHGTNTVIASIRNSAKIPFRMAPLIFVTTLLTHLCGGSAGREGAAIQLGGSIANRLGIALKLNDNSRHIIVLCGMSAGFSALFGTPLAAAFFSLEVISVGILHYSALIPCVTAAYTARYIASLFGIGPEHFVIPDLPDFTPAGFGLSLLLGILCGLVSILFCLILHHTARILKDFIKNPYIRIAVCGILIAALSCIPGFDIYLGSGIEIIGDIFEGEGVPMFAFFLKMVFTALTLGGGYKGGEIVPSLCIGAAFGCVVATLTNLPVQLVSACGMAAVFCGVTNCPVSSLFIAFELFGFEGMPFFLPAIAVCYVVSGYFGVYAEQKIVYSKEETRFVDIKTK